MRLLKDRTGKLRTLAYSPDGSKLAAAGDVGVAKLWDVASGRVLATMRHLDIHHPMTSTGRVCYLAFSHDGKLLATGTSQHVRIWDTEMGSEVPFPDELREGAAPMAFAPDDASLILAQGTGVLGQPRRFTNPLLAWSRKTGRIEGAFIESHDLVAALAVSASADLLAVASRQGVQCYVRLWGLTDKRDRGKLDLPRLPQRHLWAEVEELAFSPDGQTLAVSQGPHVFVFDLPDRRLHGTIESHPQQVASVTFAPHGRHLATASLDGTVRFWDAESLGERAAYDWKLGKMRCVRFHPDGMTAAAVGDKSAVVIWDVEGG